MRILRSLLPVAATLAFIGAYFCSTGLAGETPMTIWLDKIDLAVRKYDAWVVAARNAAILESLAQEKIQAMNLAESDHAAPSAVDSEEEVRLDGLALTLLREEYRAYDHLRDKQVNTTRTAGSSEATAAAESKRPAMSAEAIRLSDYWRPLTSEFCIYAETFDRIVAENTVALGDRFLNRTAGFWEAVSTIVPSNQAPAQSVPIESFIATHSQVAVVFGRSVIPNDFAAITENAMTPSETWEEIRTLAMKLYSVPGLRQESLAFSEAPFIKNLFSAKKSDSRLFQ